MDHYVTGATTVDSNPCSRRRTSPTPPATLVQRLPRRRAERRARRSLLPAVAGQSSANDMYFARAQFVFVDNDCRAERDRPRLRGAGHGDVDEGLHRSDDRRPARCSTACRGRGTPRATRRCRRPTRGAAAVPDARRRTARSGSASIRATTIRRDDPFDYYPSTRDKPDEMMRDFDTSSPPTSTASTLPQVVVRQGPRLPDRAPGRRTSRSPTASAFVEGVVDAVAASARTRPTRSCSSPGTKAAASSITSRRPATSTVDNQPYGTRVPLLAVGPFAKANYVSHVHDGALVDREVHRVELARWQTGQLGRATRRSTTLATCSIARRRGRRFPRTRECLDLERRAGADAARVQRRGAAAAYDDAAAAAAAAAAVRDRRAAALAAGGRAGAAA